MVQKLWMMWKRYYSEELIQKPVLRRTCANWWVTGNNMTYSFCTIMKMWLVLLDTLNINAGCFQLELYRMYKSSSTKSSTEKQLGMDGTKKQTWYRISYIKKKLSLTQARIFGWKKEPAFLWNTIIIQTFQIKTRQKKRKTIIRPFTNWQNNKRLT